MATAIKERKQAVRNLSEKQKERLAKHLTDIVKGEVEVGFERSHGHYNGHWIDETTMGHVFYCAAAWKPNGESDLHGWTFDDLNDYLRLLLPNLFANGAISFW